MFSEAAKLAQVTTSAAPTGPEDRSRLQVGSTGGGGPELSTANWADTRLELTFPTASTLWSPTAASDGTAKDTLALPVVDAEAEAITVLVEDVTYHLIEIGSLAGKPVIVLVTLVPASPDAGDSAIAALTV